MCVYIYIYVYVKHVYLSLSLYIYIYIYVFFLSATRFAGSPARSGASCSGQMVVAAIRWYVPAALRQVTYERQESLQTTVFCLFQRCVFLPVRTNTRVVGGHRIGGVADLLERELKRSAACARPPSQGHKVHAWRTLRGSIETPPPAAT